MNSDLTPVQGADTTGNPQADTGNIGASDSSSFQQSAGVDVLSKNQTLTVQETGQPIYVATPISSSSTLLWVIILTSVVAFAIAAVIIYRWVTQRPKGALIVEEKSLPKPKTIPKKAKSPAHKPKGKKKQTRSKRKKK